MGYIIYKATGGLTHMIGGLSYAIRICKKRRSKLIIDCSGHKGFGQNFSDWFRIVDSGLDYTENYDVIPSHLRFVDKSPNQLKSVQPQNSKGNYFIDRTKISAVPAPNIELAVIASHYVAPFSTKIRVTDAQKRKLFDEWAPEITNPYIAVHFRNTDIKNNIQLFADKIISCCNKYGSKIVYFATDDALAYDQIKRLLPCDYVLIQYNKPDYYGGGNLHYNCADKYSLVKNLLVDMLMILRSCAFIRSINSGVSLWLCDMIDKGYNIFDICSQTKIFGGLCYVTKPTQRQRSMDKQPHRSIRQARPRRITHKKIRPPRPARKSLKTQRASRPQRRPHKSTRPPRKLSRKL